MLRPHSCRTVMSLLVVAVAFVPKLILTINPPTNNLHADDDMSGRFVRPGHQLQEPRRVPAAQPPPRDILKIRIAGHPAEKKRGASHTCKRKVEQDARRAATRPKKELEGYPQNARNGYIMSVLILLNRK